MTFHFNITNLNRHQIRERLKRFDVPYDCLVFDGFPDYLVSRCCAVHCEEIFIYSRDQKNPHYCEKCIGGKNKPGKGVPYGQSKLQQLS